MFGAPDLEPGDEPLLGAAASSRLRTLLDPDKADDAPWPLGPDRRVLFLLDERVSPRPFRWRDRPLLLALVVSFLFHLLIVSQLRTNSLLQEIMAAQRLRVRPKPAEDNTPFYEFVQMPRARPEAPLRKAPASDLDRRAHGGVGAPALTPGSRGNTPELRLEPPGGRPAQRGGAPAAAERVASRDPADAAKPADGASNPELKLADKGASAVLVVPKEGGGAQQPSPPLKGLGGLGSFGSSGGSVPQRKGGQVDLGGLSFDTDWYDWGPYAAEMLRRIRYHWDIPEIAQMGVAGVVRIHFFIERDGRVTGLEVQRDSGRPPLDYAARDAVLNASPLPPLPDDLGGVFHEGVTITFYYNTPPPERSTNE